MKEIDGFACGFDGSSGSTLSGLQRVARSRGEPEPTRVEGRKGQGRAATVRTYTVQVTRLSDDKRLEETIGPAYHSKKKWTALMNETQKRLVARLS